MAKERVTVTLPEEMIAEIDKRAAAGKRSRSSQVEQMLHESITAGPSGNEFYMNAELKGPGRSIMPMVRWKATDGDGHHLDLDREWLVRFYVRVYPGEVGFGGMWMDASEENEGSEPE